MNNFHKLEGWNKQRDTERRNYAEEFLQKNSFCYKIPSRGCYKIFSSKCKTLMFYPKSGTIIWKLEDEKKQRIFTNFDEGKVARKLKELI